MDITDMASVAANFSYSYTELPATECRICQPRRFLRTSSALAASTRNTILQEQQPLPWTRSFLDFPGEIRNAIYASLLDLATTCRHTFTPNASNLESNEEMHQVSATISNGQITTNNIGALPMLFVNRRIKNELEGLAYSRFEYVRFIALTDGLGLKMPKDECIIPWKGLLLVPNFKVDFDFRSVESIFDIQRWCNYKHYEKTDPKYAAILRPGLALEREVDKIKSYVQKIAKLGSLQIKIRDGESLPVKRSLRRLIIKGERTPGREGMGLSWLLLFSELVIGGERRGLKWQFSASSPTLVVGTWRSGESTEDETLEIMLAKLRVR